MFTVSPEYRNMAREGRVICGGIVASIVAALLSAPASAQISVHPAVVDLAADRPQRDDLEIVNRSKERVYVTVEPSRIDAPGTSNEQRMTIADPEKLGLLASPPRLILEPGERRYARVAALSAAGDQDRIFRVTIKPVVGEVTGQATGIKVMVGYDVLVIQRPANPRQSLTWENSDTQVAIHNGGNTNIQIGEGKACPRGGGTDSCTDLPGTRIYAGQSFVVPKPPGTIATYTVLFTKGTERKTFE